MKLNNNALSWKFRSPDISERRGSTEETARLWKILYPVEIWGFSPRTQTSVENNNHMIMFLSDSDHESRPARVFCDNESVVKCTSNIEAKLKKKHTSVSYCKIKCAIAAEIIVLYYEKSETNLADLLTKVLSKEMRKKLIQCILNWDQNQH